MQLTLALWFKRTVPGHIFRGKYRLVKLVSKRAMETQVKEYQRQDKIMHLLRYPYLTVVSTFVMFSAYCYIILSTYHSALPLFDPWLESWKRSEGKNQFYMPRLSIFDDEILFLFISG